jgi:hypothetical protein
MMAKGFNTLFGRIGERPGIPFPFPRDRVITVPGTTENGRRGASTGVGLTECCDGDH